MATRKQHQEKLKRASREASRVAAEIEELIETDEPDHLRIALRFDELERVSCQGNLRAHKIYFGQE
jgi:hypothetical protein